MVASGDGDVGAVRLTNEIIQIVNKVPEMVTTLTGVKINDVM
jgi:flotillin